MDCRRRVGPVVDFAHLVTHLHMQVVRGESRCRDFAGMQKMLLSDGPRSASCKYAVDSIQVLTVCSCRSMHQYEVHGSTRVCILISRSEAFLASSGSCGRGADRTLCVGMAILLQHTSESGGKHLFDFWIQLRPIASLAVSSHVCRLLLPTTIFICACKWRINVLSPPSCFFEGPNSASCPTF